MCWAIKMIRALKRGKVRKREIEKERGRDR